MKKLLSLTIALVILLSTICISSANAAESKECAISYHIGKNVIISRKLESVTLNSSFDTYVYLNSDEDVAYMGVSVILADGTIIEPKMITKTKFLIDIPKVTADVYISAGNVRYEHPNIFPDVPNIIPDGSGVEAVMVTNLKNVSFVEGKPNQINFVKMGKNGYKIYTGSHFYELTFKTKDGYKLVHFKGIKAHTYSYDFSDKPDFFNKEFSENENPKQNDDGSYTMSFYAEGSAYLEIFAEPETVAETINITPAKAAIDVGKTKTLKATISPSDATIKDVKWQSNNTKVATVDENGKVTAVKKGTATITATALDGSGVKAKCSVTVKQPVKSIKLNVKTKTIKVGQKLKIKATVKPDNANDKYVKWIANNKKIKLSAIKTKSGKYNTVTAKKVGKTNITVKPNDGSKISVSCKITVRKK